MIASHFALVAMLALAGGQAAPTAAPAPAPVPRARPSLDLSIEMARAAITACEASGYHAAAVVLDAEALPVVILTGAGSSGKTDATVGKAVLALKYKMDSGVALARSKTDPAMAKAIADDPRIGTGRQGGVLITAGPVVLGAIAVGGAPGGDKDETCARAGLAKVAARLR